MRKNMFLSRMIALLLCMMCIVSILPVSASAAGVTVNLNDGVYTYGRFDKDGHPYNKDVPADCSFRSVNYLPVEGGRTITCYYDKAEWNGDNLGRAIFIVQYDPGKNIIGTRSDLLPYYPAGKVGLVLHEDTAFIQIGFVYYDHSITTPLDEIKIGVYYTDEYVHAYIEPRVTTWESLEEFYRDPLHGKYIVYDGDEITESRRESAYNGGSYPYLIAAATNGTYNNYAQTGAWLTSNGSVHSIVDNLKYLPDDADLYCFQGGFNDYANNVKLGQITQGYADPVDTKTVCGALEYLFRFTLMNFPGKPVCFIIPHKIRTTAIKENANGDTFQDFHDAIVQVCNKYSIPYYDAFLTSGLNGWNSTQSQFFLTGNATGTSDGTLPNEEGYRHYYLPQLLSLFRTIMPE